MDEACRCPEVSDVPFVASVEENGALANIPPFIWNIPSICFYLKHSIRWEGCTFSSNLKNSNDDKTSTTTTTNINNNNIGDL